MVTLEEILQKYFDCKEPFHAKSGRLTKSGAIAHEKLIQLIKDLEDLGVYADGRLSICQLDDIANEGISYKQEMVNDLKHFITSGSEEYKLEKPVRIVWDNRKYYVKYFTRDVDYEDIFMTENPWQEDADEDIIDFTNLSDEYAKKVFEAILSQEIENGWDWREHAIDTLLQKFPKERWNNMPLREKIFDFVEQNWKNMGTDAWNIENFMDSL